MQIEKDRKRKKGGGQRCDVQCKILRHLWTNISFGKKTYRVNDLYVSKH